MCMWQSQAPSGALSFGGSVPAEFDTCWPRLSRPIADAVAAIAIIEALLMKVRRAIMLIFLCPKTRTKDGAPGARPSRLSVSGATYSDIISPQGGDHEKIHHFPRRARLRNGIARFFRYLAGARARVDVAAAGARADASCEHRSPPDGALQDDDERCAGPRSDHPPARARCRDRQRSAPPPGSHTFGYVLEGSYEVKVGDGPLQRLGPGETFYEPPGALHAVSRNGSSTQPVKYLVIQVSDPTKPQTVSE